MAQAQIREEEFRLPLTDDPTFSYTLPSRYYTDPEIFELEKEKIFHRSWTYLCHASQVRNAGDYVADSVAGQGVFAVRGRDGELRAFHNVCQHRAHELVRGSGTSKAVITCPYHAWAYGLDGELRTARNCEHVRGFDRRDFGLKPVRVEVLCDLVFVNLDPDATPLAALAPGLAADIRARLPYWDELETAEVYDFGGRPIEAGWKVVVDNYIECYHCDVAHPDFADLICMPSYRHAIDGITARQSGPDIRRDNNAYPVAGDAAVQQSLFWYVWPTTTINVMPGNGDMMITRIVPQNHLRTRFVNHRLAPRRARRRAGPTQLPGERPGRRGHAAVRVRAARPVLAGLRPGTFRGGSGPQRNGRTCRPFLPQDGPRRPERLSASGRGAAQGEAPEAVLVVLEDGHRRSPRSSVS